MIHSGNIHNDTAAGRVYRWLRERSGAWHEAPLIEQQCHVRALGTHASEVNAQLKLAKPRTEEIKCKREGMKWFYRHVTIPAQMEIFTYEA